MMYLKVIKNIFRILYVVLFFMLIGCRNERKNETLVNDWYGKQLLFPNSQMLKNDFFIETKKKNKILALINGDCDACVNDLNAWKGFMKKVDTSKVGFAFIITRSAL